MKKYILITGGAGYIGTHTAVALHKAGYTPIIVDNFTNSTPKAIAGVERIIGTPVRSFTGDCANYAFMKEVFATLRSDATPIIGAVHFAAHKAVGESVQEPLSYYRNNITSLLTLLEVIVAQNTATPFPLIFSSSATVYGDPTPEALPLTEDTPRAEATNPYGNTKRIGEDILRDSAQAWRRTDHPLRAITLRYFNPIGAHPSASIGERPTGTPNNLVPYLTQAAAGIRPPLTVFGDDYPTPDGTGVRDYIHVCDLADAHVAALHHALNTKDNDLHYDTFNIGTGTGTSVKELITLFERETSVEVPHTIGPRRDGDIATCYADCSKANDVLHWRARYTIADALRHAWTWQLKATDI